MTVLYIIDYVTQGGAIRSFCEMVIALKKLGVRPIVCTSNRDHINDYLNDNGIQNISIGHKTVLRPVEIKGIKGPLRMLKHGVIYYFSEWIALYKISRFIKGNHVDIIHTNSARSDIGCFINKKYKIPHVMHIREFADADFDCISFRPNYIDIFNKYTTKFVSISNAVKNHWIKKGVDSNKIVLVYNGIKFEDITESSDQNKRESFKMIIAGGVVPTKGQKIAIEALTYLPDPIKRGVKLDIVGWGINEYIQELKRLVKTVGLDKNVRFVGPVNDVHKHLGDYQVGLMCSKAEGFGRVTAEYMHAKLGVIASNSGANPELIQDGENGLLFKSGDAMSLAACIERLYNDRDLLIRLSHAAKDKARRSFTQEGNAKNIAEIYKEVNNHCNE